MESIFGTFIVFTPAPQNILLMPVFLSQKRESPHPSALHFRFHLPQNKNKCIKWK